MNPTAIAFDRAGQMYVSSRFDGTVYRVAPNGTMSSYAEGMGVATGIAFDRAAKSLRRRPQRNHFQDRHTTGRFSCSQLSSQASPLITWRSARAEICS